MSLVLTQERQKPLVLEMSGQREREIGSKNPEGWAGREKNDGIDREVGEFVRYVLVEKEYASFSSAIFTLRHAAGEAFGFHETRRRNCILSFQIKHPKLQIFRSYTPLSPITDQDFRDLRFLIRKATNGEVSGHLHRLGLGSEIELRGPTVHCVLPELVHSVILLAGGVGIAPAMQIAEYIGADATLHILWGSRRAEECVGGISDTNHARRKSEFNLLSGRKQSYSEPVQKIPSEQQHAIVVELESFKALRAGRMKVDYFIDGENTFIGPGDILRAVNQSKSSTNNILLVSGPEGFVDHWAGPRQRVNGEKIQGPLGGVISTLDLRGWQVIKL